MANDYFDSIDSLRRFTLAKAGDVNALFNEVEVGFDRLPGKLALAQDMITYAVAGGTANALTVALPQTLAALTDGVRITVKAPLSPTGACTINVDGLGPRAIKRPDQSNPGSSEWLAGDVLGLVFAQNSWVLLSETGYVARRANEAAASAAAALADKNTTAADKAIVAADKAIVAADRATVAADKATVNTDKGIVAADKATVLGYKNTVNTDKGIVAADKAIVAADKAIVAADKATVAADKATATAQATAALASANSAAASYDNFDDRYLGPKSVNPTVDNDGGALIAGALYFNTAIPEMRVRTATAWISTGYNSESIDINGGTVDGVNIGVSVAGSGKFTTLNVTGTATITGLVNGRNIATDGTKLNGIEALADVTDTINVTAAGALMDSELTNIAAIKALNQGVGTADSPTHAALTTTGQMTAGTHLQHKGLVNVPTGGTSILFPEGGYFNGAAAETGFIKITMPQGFLNTMLRMTVRVFNYIQNSSVDYVIAGYTATTGWTRTTAFALNSPILSNNLPVAFGVESGKAVILIGNADTAWYYPKVVVQDFFASHSNWADSLWRTGWTVGVGALGTATISSTITQTELGQSAAIALNTAKLTNVSTNLSWLPATLNGRIDSSDGTNATITAVDATNAGLMLPAHLTKLNGIETAATGDQTGAEIKTLYQAQVSAFTDALFTKLAGIETGATADQTAAQLLALLKTVDVGGTAGLNAGTLDGLSGEAGSAVINTVAVRDPAGDIFARLIRSEFTLQNATVNNIMTQVTPGVGTDNYIRPSSPAQVMAAVGATRSITTGNGLTGGGTLGANLTLTVVGGSGITATATGVQVDSTVARNNAAQTFSSSVAATVFVAGNGTELLPSLTFGTDPNTGIYSDTADIIKFTTAGSHQVGVNTVGFFGNGVGVTALNGTNVTSGTIASARVSGYDVALAKLAGIEAGATADLTAAQILASLKTVDVDGTAGLNAGTLNSLGTAASSAVNNTIAARDGSGDIHARIFRSEYATLNATVNNIMTQVTPGVGGDNYIRPSTPAQVMAAVGATRTITTGNGLTGGGTLAGNLTLTVVGGSGINATATGVEVDSTVARTTVSMVAGNGLSGGGTLAASRTITLGTPGAITAVSTDAVTATSHTHSLSAANVGTRMGQLAVGNVGTFAMLYYPGNLNVYRTPGFSVAGSALRFATASGFANGNANPAAGTWELQGVLQNTSGTTANTSTWLRVI